ncbi:MAG: response regulator [Caulobacter sp.]|nr:response regulator [Caulobacter sp.]
MTAPAAAAFSSVVLVVDDDIELRDQIALYLTQHGYTVKVAATAIEMDRVLATGLVNLVLLDIMLPGEDGLSVCRRLADAAGPPVIMISAMGEEIDRILGLELGADDYLPKPCNPRELLARVRAVLRRREDGRGEAARGRVYQFLGFKLDTGRRSLKSPAGVGILLTGGEFALLCAFLEQPQRILSRNQLIEMARGETADVFDRAIDVQISRLRRKLHSCTDHDLIQTYRGSGYMLDARVARL